MQRLKGSLNQLPLAVQFTEAANVQARSQLPVTLVRDETLPTPGNRRAAATAVAQAEKRFPIVPVRQAHAHGIHPIDDVVFRAVARSEQLVIVLRDANPCSVPFMERADCLPKPSTIKAKTRKSEPNAGLVACDPADYPTLEAWRAAKKELEAGGFRLSDAREGYLVTRRNPEGRVFRFYSDYDLHGVWKLGSSLDAWSDGRTAWVLNLRLGRQMILHGPQDLWEHRNGPGPNQGPQPPATAYLPSGKAVRLETAADLKAFYLMQGRPWHVLYPGA